jgi:hypothetical protein
LCDELGQDATTLSKPSKDRQLAVAKRLTNSDFTESDLRSMVRWLLPQPWVNGSCDLLLIEKQRGKWELAGKPSRPPEPTPLRPAASTAAERSLRNVERAFAHLTEDTIDVQGRITS